MNPGFLVSTEDTKKALSEILQWDHMVETLSNIGDKAEEFLSGGVKFYTVLFKTIRKSFQQLFQNSKDISGLRNDFQKLLDKYGIIDILTPKIIELHKSESDIFHYTLVSVRPFIGKSYNTFASVAREAIKEISMQLEHLFGSDGVEKIKQFSSNVNLDPDYISSLEGIEAAASMMVEHVLPIMFNTEKLPKVFTNWLRSVLIKPNSHGVQNNKDDFLSMMIELLKPVMHGNAVPILVEGVRDRLRNKQEMSDVKDLDSDCLACNQVVWAVADRLYLKKYEEQFDGDLFKAIYDVAVNEEAKFKRCSKHLFEDMQNEEQKILNFVGENNYYGIKEVLINISGKSVRDTNIADLVVNSFIKGSKMKPKDAEGFKNIANAIQLIKFNLKDLHTTILEIWAACPWNIVVGRIVSGVLMGAIQAVRKVLKDKSITNIHQDEEEGPDFAGIFKLNQFPFPYGVIPYKLDVETIGLSSIPVIAAGVFMIEQSSCVRFVHINQPPIDGATWLHISNPDQVEDCYYKPRDGKDGEKILVLGFSCFEPHHVARVLLSGMGFAYENNRVNRDRSVSINWSNILPEKRHLFRVDHESISWNTEYDPKSIMHFPSRLFSRNSRPTISVHGFKGEVGVNVGLSDIDKVKLKLYFASQCGNRQVDQIYNTCMSLKIPSEK